MESLASVTSLEQRARDGLAAIRRIDVFAPACPGHRIMDVIASKWTILTIYALTQGTTRYADLERKILGVSPKMLTQVLRKLESKRLIERTVYPTVPPSVEYSLTPLGWSLVPALTAICKWADDHLEDL